MGTGDNQARDGFAVGPVTVEPMLNRLSLGDNRLSVEPKVMDLLVELAAEPGAMRSRADLLDKVWGLNHGGDESLTKAVSSLRHALAELAPGERFVETVPKRGYRLVAPVDYPEARAGGAAKGSNRRLAGVLVLAVLALVALAFALRAWTASPPGFDHVAVGPVAPQGERATALQAALLRELALGGVQAVPESEGADTPLRITASFARQGGKDSVTVAVEARATGQPLWSRRYALGGDAGDAGAERIAWEVGNAVSCGVLGNVDLAHPLRDPALVGFFIRACDQFRGNLDFGALLVNAEKAVAYAPDSAVAKLRYAISGAWLALNSHSADESARLAARSRQVADAIVAEQPENGVAWYARGIARWAQGDPIAAMDDLRKARRLAPEYPFTLNALTSIALDLGYNDEGFDYQRQAVIADHFSLVQQARLAEQLADRGFLADAHAQLDKIRPVAPVAACLRTFDIDQWWAEPAAALAELDSPCVQAEMPAAETACARRFLGFRQGTVDADSAWAACRHSEWFDTVRYGVVTGHMDDAVAIAMQRDPRRGNAAHLFFAQMRPLQRDPRMMQIAAHYGLVKIWRAADHWPDFCADPDLGYDCREVAAGE